MSAIFWPFDFSRADYLWWLDNCLGFSLEAKVITLAELLVNRKDDGMSEDDEAVCRFAYQTLSQEVKDPCIMVEAPMSGRSKVWHCTRHDSTSKGGKVPPVFCEVRYGKDRYEKDTNRESLYVAGVSSRHEAPPEGDREPPLLSDAGSGEGIEDIDPDVPGEEVLH